MQPEYTSYFRARQIAKVNDPFLLTCGTLLASLLENSLLGAFKLLNGRLLLAARAAPALTSNITNCNNFISFALV